MIEGGRLPGGRVVTDRAVMGKELRHVVRIVRLSEIRNMARIAVGRGVRELSVDVAL